MIMKYLPVAILIAGMFALLVQADEERKPDQPVELGNVKWLRDLDKAVASSKEGNKPIAILFQEVPG